MEVKEKSKKRELIKTIAIVFLAVLLVLTFFSQTIMNHSLPEVATQVVSSGTINAKIRGSGTVSANESYEVILNQTREVRSVCVKAGDKVEQGDLLFVLGDVESQELQEAQAQLSQLQIDYQSKILNFSKEYATNDLSLKNIREDLEKAMAARDANLVTDTELSYAKGDLAAAKTQVSQLALMIEELTAIQSEDEEYAEAEAKVKELENKIKGLNDNVKSYQDELDKIEGGAGLDADRAIQDARTALERAQTNWAGDWQAYREALEGLMAAAGYSGWVAGTSPRAISSAEQVAVERLLAKWELEQSGTTTQPDGETDAPTGLYTEGNYRPWRSAYDTLIADQNDVEAKQRAYDRAVQDQSAANGSVYDQRRAVQKKIDEAESEISSAQRELRDAQQRLDTASSANTQVKEQLRLYESAKREQDANVTTLTDALAELEAKQKDYEAALETIAAKERELENALSGKDIDKQLDNLELQTLRLQMEKQQTLVDKYKKDSVDTEITSKVSGIISAVNVTAGKENKAGEAMAVIDVVDRGYTIKISVTSEQAKQVKVGDTADVTNYYWGNDVTATLEQITPDPASPGQKKLLVFRITGEIDAGSSINLSIGQRSANFETIVPKSALREDTNGKFVLVVMSRSTPLGNRYTATRVDVQVLAEDDTNAAVSGLAANDYVITTSSKPLDAGTLVRMVENP